MRSLLVLLLLVLATCAQTFALVWAFGWLGDRVAAVLARRLGGALRGEDADWTPWGDVRDVDAETRPRRYVGGHRRSTIRSLR